MESGGVDYITKPFQQLEVLARIELHLRLRRLELERQENVARLEKMNKEKDEVLGIISHDMRNPIGGIIGISNFLRTDGPSDDKELNDMLKLIESSAERLLLLVNDLLDIALIEANSLQLTFTDTDLGAYCHDVIQLHRATAKSKGVRLDLIERVVHHARGGTLAAAAHDAVDELGDDLVLVAGVGLELRFAGGELLRHW